MVELVWKGKHTKEQEPYSHAKIATQQLSSYETIEGQLADAVTKGPLYTTQQWYNRLILGEKNAILQALLPEFTEQINLVYIDPPFMTGRDFTSGKQLAFSDKWDNDLDMYLQWLYETLTLIKLLLTVNGSLYIHLDWRVTHYARVLLDEIFGLNSGADGPGFKNEIIWQYQSGGRSQKRYARKHDTILFYSKSAHYCFHGERIGERRGSEKRNHMKKWVDTDGRTNWTIHSAGRLYSYGEDTHMTPTDVWSDISHLHQKNPERNGYATQKPAALLERVILASSEENDLVLDCFCGSGVTPAVAEKLGRRWIACDQSELALQLTRERLLTCNRMHPFVMQRLENDTTEHGS